MITHADAERRLYGLVTHQEDVIRGRLIHRIGRTTWTVDDVPLSLLTAIDRVYGPATPDIPQEE